MFNRHQVAYATLTPAALLLLAAPLPAAGGVCPGSVNFYGQATLGSNSVAPSIGLSGCAESGASVSVDIGSGQPGAPTCILFGSELGGSGLSGFGNIVLVDALTDIPVVLDGAGAASVDLVIPSGSAMVGDVISVQAVCLDAGTAFGISASVGMNVAIGDSGPGPQ